MTLEHSKSIFSTFELHWVLGFGFWVRVLAYVTQGTCIRLAGAADPIRNLFEFQTLSLTANWRK